MQRHDSYQLRRRALTAARQLGEQIDRALADRPHGRSCSLAPRRDDGTRPIVFNFNSNGGSH